MELATRGDNDDPENVMMPRKSCHRALNARGVTLVELMIVVAIIAIVAGIASPTIFKSLRRERAAGVAREVANELRRARNQAMARGEIILVQVVPAGAAPTIDTNTDVLPRGGVVSFATNTAPYEAGTTACVAPDGGDPDDLCPAGSTCVGGECWSQPARSCRQVDLAEAQFSREVARFALHTSDAVHMSLLGHTGPASVLTLCFSPDGRVLDRLGRVHTPSVSGVTCPGENVVLWLAKADAAAADVSAAALCTAGYDDRDPLNLYRISVPFNGSIAMDQ